MTDSCNLHMGIEAKKMCIEKVPIFNHLEKNEMKEILKLSKRMSVEKGDIIFRAGDPLEYLYIVHIGRVKIYQLFEDGKEQLLRILERGEFMGELALFTEKTLDSYAEALVKTEICAIHRNDMQQFMNDHPTIPLKILSEFSKRLEKTEALVGQLSYRDVETRLANYLVKLAVDKKSTQIHLPMSKKDLAAHLGTTQETISRRLGSFQTKGWIDQQGQREITILNMNTLREIAIST